MAGSGKHRTVNRFIAAIFQRNEVYFAKTSEFNDPFDSRVYFRHDPTEKELMHIAIETTRRWLPDAPPALLRSKAEPFFIELVRMGRDNYESTLQDFMSQFFDDQFSVFAASTKNDDLAMWGHYADNHRGICIEFSTAYPPFRGYCNRVSYSMDYPTVDAVGQLRGVTEAVLTKSTAWSSEQEWRILSTFHGTVTLDRRAITGVILGCRMSEKEKETVRDWVAKKVPRPRLYQATLARKEYRLLIEPLT